MKISLLLENLQKKILFVNHAISPRSQLPTLLNFLIEAREGKLSISATDLEIGIIVDVPGKIEKSDLLPKLELAANIVVTYDQASVSLLQRKLTISYGEASRLMDQLEGLKIVSPFNGNKGREVLIKDFETLHKQIPSTLIE